MADTLAISGLGKRFGALKATDNLNLVLRRGELHAVIGPNGAGKTTLVAQICGQLEPDEGSISFEGRDITRAPPYRMADFGLVRSFQITSIFPEFSALENIALAAQLSDGHSFRFWEPASCNQRIVESARAYLGQVDLSDLADTRASALSHGQQRRLELGMTLAREPTLLILDEPLAGMGAEETADIVELLRGLKGRVSMLLVEHDMDAVFALADRISVLVYGQIVASGDAASIRNDQRVRDAYLGNSVAEDA